MKLKISSKYAETFNSSEVTFIEAIKEFGYYNEIIDELKKYSRRTNSLRKTKKDFIRLLADWFIDLVHNDAKLSKLRDYLNPVQEIKEKVVKQNEVY